MKEKNKSKYFRKAVRATKNKQGKEHKVSPRNFQEATKKTFFFFSFVIMTEAKEALNFFSDRGSHLNVQRSLFSRSCFSLHKY